MRDRVIRRRRTVLALVAIACAVLLVALFGKSSSSPLHPFERAVVSVVAPIRDGALKVLSPFRDISNWVATTLRARSQVAQLRALNESLTMHNATYKYELSELPQLRREIRLDRRIDVAKYAPVSATVISRPPMLQDQEVQVDEGADVGVRVGDPVLGDGGLVGKVASVNSTSAEVLLISSHADGVVVRVGRERNETGVLEAGADDVSTLLLWDLPNPAGVAVGKLVATAGFPDPANPPRSGSLYPPGIPVGRIVAGQTISAGSDNIKVAPLAALDQLTFVQILTKP